MDAVSVARYGQQRIDEEMGRAILAEAGIEPVEEATRVLNDGRMDVARTYESLARRVEKLITKAEENEDDGFALSAMESLRRVLRDIASMHGKLNPNLTVNLSLAESKEWAVMRRILQEVCDEVPAAREPLLRHMRHHVLSVTKEEQGL